MELDEINDDAEMRMMETVEVLENKLRGVRTGRPNPSMIDNIAVEAYLSLIHI